MKLPWNQKYLQISFHVVVTILIIYILGRLIQNMQEAFLIVRQSVHTFVTVMGPLLTALVFSYLVNPIVAFFDSHFFKRGGQTEELYRKRTLATAATYAVLAVVLFLLGRAIAVKIGDTDINKIAESINESIQGFGDMLVLLNVKLAEIGLLENVDVPLQNFIDGFVKMAQNFIFGFANSFSKAGGWVLNLGIGLTVAFYLLAEKEKILYYCSDGIRVFFTRKWADRILRGCHDVNAIFSGYIGGQVTDAIIVAVMMSVTFSILKIPYAIVIGCISGFSNLIPYVGAIVAFVLSVSVGLLSGTPVKALYAAIAVVVLQQIDGMFIVPRVVGKSVELHPVLVLLSLSVFGSLFGLLGMIVAVPITAILKLYLLKYYRIKKDGRTGETL